MKKLILLSCFLPVIAWAPVQNPNESTHLVEVRGGEWPINLERDIDNRDTTYLLLFRDQQVSTSVMMDTLAFEGVTQLKYFGQALTVLKTGSHGDIAKFKDFSIKRSDVKYQGVWYLLRIKWGLTNFQQPEADLLIKTIRGL